MTICLNSQGLEKQLEHFHTHTLICCWLPRHIIHNYIVRSGARERERGERNKGRILSLRVIKRKRDIYRGNNIVEYSHTYTLTHTHTYTI